LEEIITQQVPFSGHFNLFLGKLLCREFTLLLYFPLEFLHEFILSIFFLQMTEIKKFFSRETLEIFLPVWELNLNLLITCYLPYPLSYIA
jgi:hypothetical protein